MDKNLVNKIFQQARKDLYYPPISTVEFSNISTSQIDLSGRRHKILIGEKFVKRLSEKALLGVFHHELNHWVKHPYDAKTIILEYYWLGETSNKNIVRNLYDDIVTNLDLIINKGLEEVATVYQQTPPICIADQLLREFCQKVTGLDFGIREQGKFNRKLEELSKIDFLDTSRPRLKNNIKQFSRIIESLVDKETKLPFSTFSLADFTPEEVKRAMRDIAREVDTQEYRKIAGEVLKDLTHAGKRCIGISPGSDSLIKDLEGSEIAWYKNRAQRFTVSITAFSKEGSLYPNEIKDFGLDDSIDTFSAVESYGKILPGLSKKYELEEFEGYKLISIPDAVIIIDSSGSMRNPDTEISYAVLGAFAIARNYFEHGSKVGVINFSDRNLELEPTKDRNKVYKMLRVYQGGGTTLRLDALKQYMHRLKNNEKEIDYILLTDAGIDNIHKVVNYFLDFKDRLTIIWIKCDAKEDKRFQESYRLLKEKLPLSVTFVEVEDEKDIPRIAVGKSFGNPFVA